MAVTEWAPALASWFSAAYKVQPLASDLISARYEGQMFYPVG